MTHGTNLLVALSFSIAGANAASLQADLVQKYPITKVAQDGSVVTAGASLVLQKNSLATWSINAPLPAMNTWKNGKLSQSVGRALSVGMAMGNNASSVAQRKFVAGELLWTIGIAVEKDAIVFRLLSDDIGGIRYCGDLKFPFPKGNPPAFDQAVQEISEVLTVQEPAKPATDETAATPKKRNNGVPQAAPPTGAAPTPAAAPTEDKPLAPIPPPPPPPADPQTVNLGDTPEKVVAALGQPKNIVNLGEKRIYVYPELKSHLRKRQGHQRRVTVFFRPAAG